MLVVISPAKRLEWEVTCDEMTTPTYQDDAIRLAKTARNLTLRDLKSLMDLSDDLARLNRDRFKHFEADPAPDRTRPAALAFAGDTYQGLEAGSLSADEMIWAQDHLRILSGLYGLLRPLDAIQPYRLEMGSRLKTRRGTSLYAYWRDQIAKDLNVQGTRLGTDVLINCASKEYFDAVAPRTLKLRVVTPVFMEDRENGSDPKVVSFFAKRARGAMARYVVQNRLIEPQDIRHFDLAGYRFDVDRSTDKQPVFVRPYPAAA
ncbi:MAG: peroxide stress protein YaaA [Pseudomonadota bacterium]